MRHWMQLTKQLYPHIHTHVYIFHYFEIENIDLQQPKNMIIKSNHAEEEKKTVVLCMLQHINTHKVHPEK